MAQQIINTGTGPDTGDGDDLYVAFSKVNQNFTSLWQYGPVDSNIQIANNQISVTNTNGNLILNPQGVGVVQVNNSVLPRFHNTFSLGSDDLRFRSAYFGTGGVEINGNLTLNGSFFGNINFGNTIVANLQGNVLTANGNTVLNQQTRDLNVVTANVANLLQAGNILPLANAVYSLGNIDLQWKDLWLAGNTLYLANTGLTNEGGTLFWGNNAVVTQLGDDIVISGGFTANTVTANLLVSAPVANISGNVIAGNVLTDNLLYANGQPWDLELPGGNNTEIQFNSNGAFGGSSAFVFDQTSNSVTVSGNITATDVSVLENLTSNTLSANSIAGIITTANQPNITELGTLSTLTVAGNASANNLSGNTISGTLTTAAQPNITTVGTLSALNVSGNATVGNLTVDGNLVYINVETLSVQDPIIQLQVSNNGEPPTSNTGFDVGTALNYFDSQAQVAFMGWDVSNGEFGFGSRTTITNEVVAFDSYGNLRANVYLGASANLAANVIAGGILTDNIYYANGQPYIFGGVPGGANSDLQFNNNGVFGGSSSLTFDSAVSNLILAGNLLSSGNVFAGNLALTDDLLAGGVYAAANYSDVLGSFGTRGQYLASDGNGKTYWATHFYVGDGSDINFDNLVYGDIFFFQEPDTGFQRLYMWVTDGVSDYFYDFLPPEF
jgi:hypothetical protein